MTGLPKFIGFGPADPERERETLPTKKTLVKCSQWSPLLAGERVVQQRTYTGRSLLLEPEQTCGEEVDLGGMTPKGAAQFKKAVLAYDYSKFSGNGTDGDNCAQAVRKLTEEPLGVVYPETPARNETSGSILAQAQHAVHEERNHPEKNPSARELRELPPVPDAG